MIEIRNDDTYRETEQLTDTSLLALVKNKSFS